jgi:aryl-alcohol dehydrogenase
VGMGAADIKLPGTVNDLFFRGASIKAIIEGDSNPDDFLPELIEHYKAGRLPIERLITTYKLSEINQAIADQHSGACVKAVLIPDTVAV